MYNITSSENSSEKLFFFHFAGEKKHLLDFIRFVTLREVRSTYPLLLNYTDFLNSFDEMIGTFRNILTTENVRNR